MAPPDASSAQDAAQRSDAAPASNDALTLIPDPSWDCRMPDGIPPPGGGALVFEANLQIGDVMDVGQTQYGRRLVIPIDSGSFSGPKIQGQFMQGGLDWQLTRPSGAIEVEAVAILTTSDGASIYLRNCGLAPDDSSTVRIVPDFEASSGGAYDWLNTGKFVGKRVLDMAKKTLTLSVYEAQPAPSGSASVTMPKKDPALPSQAWACEPPDGAAGALVYMEDVAIGGGISIGESKYGMRNIIPITGGSFSGQRLNGSVVPGGADFQLTPDGSADLQLDARYTLRTGDGELIAVRNCGVFSGTKLYFETRSDGPYAWLNGGHFTSSVSLALDGVAISIYEAQ
jgi:hypothetical protein